jgi:hypothetical protein
LGGAEREREEGREKEKKEKSALADVLLFPILFHLGLWDGASHIQGRS